MSKKEKIVGRLLKQLDLTAEQHELVPAGSDSVPARQRLRAWQADRLACTHADLLENPRFRETALFFLTDIYGPRGLSRYEADVRRVVPVMTRVLPVAGLATVADAVELNALSETLDAAMVEALGKDVERLDEATYGRAYRLVDRRPQREHQIDLIERLGHSLDRLTHHAFAGKALSMMRRPATIAGLGELQIFLERGYKAFHTMGGADDFLDIVASRERAILKALFAGDDSLLKQP